jgi:hypothetical protein
MNKPNLHRQQEKVQNDEENKQLKEELVKLRAELNRNCDIMAFSNIK